MKHLKRVYDLEFPVGQSIFLMGARKTGKTTFLKNRFPESMYIDLLKSDIARKYSRNPEKLRHTLSMLSEEQRKHPVIIDEIQLIPELLNEIHWLIENANLYFILCGSSTKKLRAAGVNLLGGRAWTYYFFPLVYPEFEEFDLVQVLERGAIPSHYLSPYYKNQLEGYIHNYLTMEIQHESFVRNLKAFQSFLEVAAFSNGELINYANIGREAGVDAKTIKSYFDILEDSLIGYRLLPFQERYKRENIFKSPKFYYFDVGLVNSLKRAASPLATATIDGHILESYIFQELKAYCSFYQPQKHLNFWRTFSGQEVDFVLNRNIAIEVKLSNNIHTNHFKGLISFAEEHQAKDLILVCNEDMPRLVEHKGYKIKVLPVEDFLERLWNKE